MSSTISSRPRSSSLTDRASVRGVKRGRKNRKRRREAAMPQRRTLSWVVRAIGFVLLAVILGFTGRAVYAYSKTSPTFAIDRIEVTGQKRANEESIIRLSNIAIGDNLFQVEPNEVAKMVEAHPWIERAEITRAFPRGVEIEIVEHEPVALVALDHLYYANRAGEIVKRYSPGEREVLPVITGLSREQMETDEGESRALMLLGIRFLDRLHEKYGAAAPDVGEIHVDPAVGVSFTERNDETRVVVGHPPWGDRIDRIERVKAALEKRGVEASRIMLDGRRRQERAVARLSGGERE